MKPKTPPSVVEATPVGQPSFIREMRTSRGRLIAKNHFRLPDASHADGLTRGRLAALEYLRYMVMKNASTCCPFAVVVAAAAAGLTVPGQSGNSAGFLATLERMVFFALRHSNFEADIAGALALRATEDARSSAAKAWRRRELVARLKSGRDAKRLLAAIAKNEMSAASDAAEDTA